MVGPDPRQDLALRLRALREDHWPGRRVRQAQLAAALSRAGRSVSVPLVSSWESQTNPKVPPESRIQDIATFFASPRSFDGEVGRLLNLAELTAEEQAAREALLGTDPPAGRGAARARHAPGPGHHLGRRASDRSIVQRRALPL